MRRFAQRSICNAHDTYDPTATLLAVLSQTSCAQSYSTTLTAGRVRFFVTDHGSCRAGVSPDQHSSDNASDDTLLISKANQLAAQNVRRFLQKTSGADQHAPRAGTFANYDALFKSFLPARKTRNGAVTSGRKELVSESEIGSRQVRADQYVTGQPSGAVYRRVLAPEKHGERVGADQQVRNEAHKNANVDRDTHSPSVVADTQSLATQVGSNAKHGTTDVRYRLITPHPWTERMSEIATLAADVKEQDLEDKQILESLRARLDYNGNSIEPRRSSLETPLAMPWAAEGEKMAEMTASETLDEEIKHFTGYWALKSVERRARKSIVMEARRTVKNIFPENICEISGSEASGLAMLTSDIDLRLYRRKKQTEIHFLNNFHKLYYSFRSSDDYVLTTLRMGKYRMINTQHRATRTDIQIIESPPGKQQRRATAKYLKELPNLRTVYMLLHTALSMRGLVDVYHGGTGSYGLLMMIVAAFKIHNQPSRSRVGEQLRQVLDFYAELDTTKYGVSIEPPEVFEKHNLDPPVVQEHKTNAHARGDLARFGQWDIGHTRPLQPYLLCLQDPVAPWNDLGRKGNAVKHIIATLRYVRSDLEAIIERGKFISNGVSGRGTILEILLGRCHEVYLGRRRLLEEYGMSLQRASQSPQQEKSSDIKHNLLSTRQQSSTVVDNVTVGVQTPWHSSYGN